MMQSLSSLLRQVTPPVLTTGLKHLRNRCRSRLIKYDTSTSAATLHSKRFVLLVPQGVRTGGPEAMLQLSDALIAHGCPAECWFLGQELDELSGFATRNDRLVTRSFTVRPGANTIPEFSHYKHNSFAGMLASEHALFIVPETYAWMIPILRGQTSNVLVWWLSVNNAFRTLSTFNLIDLYTPGVFHAAQSTYAQAFLNALQLPFLSLTDYTSVATDSVVALPQRPTQIAIAAGPKVRIDLQALEAALHAALPSYTVLMVRGMTREAIMSCFATSRLFIDLGCFPGKDRMFREALALGTPVITSLAGSAAYHEDCPLPHYAKVHPLSAAQAAAAAKFIVSNLDQCIPDYRPAIELVSRERQTFNNEVAALLNQHK